MLKDISKIAKKINDSELNSSIIELQGQVMDLYNENIELVHDVSELKKEKEISSNVSFSKTGYVLLNKTGPYCPGCYGKSKKLVRLTSARGTRGTRHYYKCSSCKSTFDVRFENDIE
ncbi:MAG: hypothetical protein LKE77_08330 [Companilactobacillus sp.]|jgi:hypothetical protein|uniref:hypothetical protein n=1 Tax=Companilactobacillus sp. TaxID=2767905 RepID=UPI0025C1A53D|nr:hypothetical protein [Companilactobacillus sp.]MCH4010362.1 hypothetical protein [Companilactobacillus sp.]MCH4051962.1 hypothetical protein [Companilactobacillus sp.]MCH4075802.1 hypothetical protein [Companilactobacillus sp.]MCH4126880.1 hypothetical protein [Companilactobacillus sp.]